MAYIRTVLIAIALAAGSEVFAIAVSKAEQPDWASAIAEPCQRCVPARREQNAPVSLPNHAVVYSFTGEFATKGEWWLINLDSGEVTQRKWILSKGSDLRVDTMRLGKVDPEGLAALRVSAARLWRSRLPSSPALHFAPGTSEDDRVISGQRAVVFNRLDPSDSYIVEAVEAALKTIQGVN